MATQVQLRRGTSAENDAFTGALGEVTVDTTNNTLRVHDGSTAGGFPVAPSSTTASKDLDNLSNTGKANISAQGTYDSGATYNAGTVGKAIQGKANVDMDNLTATGANIANWSSNVSNCITEIPQDIKLELNNGTLTLKAGSKVYVPNGAGVFDTITTTNDLTTTYSGLDDTLMVFLRKSGDGLSLATAARVVSGTTDSLAGSTYHNWYDTTNNVIHRYTSDASTPDHDCSFPICVATVSGGAISSIDQVFNGFGYIGSTVFALPGVKGLIPNGRNADGTLKSTALNITAVKTQTSSTVGNNMILRMYSNGSMYWSTGNTYYDPFTNYTMAGGSKDTAVHVGTLSTTTGGVIASFNTKTAFHAVDYSDTEFIAHQAMPSGGYVDLTLGTSGSSYTAPADGYICLVKTGNDTERITIRDLTTNFESSSYASNNQNLGVFLPLCKGSSFSVIYSASGSTQYFRFIYANGSK